MSGWIRSGAARDATRCEGNRKGRTKARQGARRGGAECEGSGCRRGHQIADEKFMRASYTGRSRTAHLNWGRRGRCPRRRWDTRPTPPAGRQPTAGRREEQTNGRETKSCIDLWQTLGRRRRHLLFGCQRRGAFLELGWGGVGSLNTVQVTNVTGAKITNYNRFCFLPRAMRC